MRHKNNIGLYGTTKLLLLHHTFSYVHNLYRNIWTTNIGFCLSSSLSELCANTEAETETSAITPAIFCHFNSLSLLLSLFVFINYLQEHKNVTDYCCVFILLFTVTLLWSTYSALLSSLLWTNYIQYLFLLLLLSHEFICHIKNVWKWEVIALNNLINYA